MQSQAQTQDATLQVPTISWTAHRHGNCIYNHESCTKLSSGPQKLLFFLPRKMTRYSSTDDTMRWSHNALPSQYELHSSSRDVYYQIKIMLQGS